MSEVLKAVSGIAALAFGKNSKEDKKHIDEGNVGLVSVKAQLDRRKIAGGGDYDGHLMVSITGSDKGFKRTPICTVLVADVSGSMGGAKLTLLKETAVKIAQNLTDKDEIAIVAFGSHVETVLERTNAGNREPVLAAIARLQCMGCTNLSGGFQQGLQQVNEKFKGVKRIMLLTDGVANEGIADRGGLLKMVKGRDSSSTLSTFGFGTDCDQELLADMSKAAGGNYYFISGKDIKSVFARELGGMLSCIGQNLKVHVKPNRGGEVLEVLNDFTVDDKGGDAVINAEDLFAGETKHVLLRLKVAKPEGKPKARPFSVAHIEVSWDGVKSKKHEKVELNPKATFVKEKDADAEPVIEVAEQVALIEAANAQLKAVEAAERGDFAGAQGILRGAAVMFCGLADRGSESAKGLQNTMRSSMKGFAAGTYSAAYGSTVSNAAINATKYRKGSGEGDEFLSSNVMGTQSMDSLEADFKDGSAAGLDSDSKPESDSPTKGVTNPINHGVVGGIRVTGEPNGDGFDEEAQWTNDGEFPVTDINVDVPVNNTPCTGDYPNCFCHACNVRRTVEHIDSHAPLTGDNDVVWKSSGKSNLTARLKKDDYSKFAKRSLRWR